MLLPLAAQSAAAQPPEQQVEQLQKRVDELEAQVKALQAQADADEKRKADAAESAGQGPEGMRDMLTPLGLGALQIRGFNDFDFRAFRNGGDVNTFSLGQLDLFLSSRIGADFSTLGEIVFEAGDANGFGRRCRAVPAAILAKRLHLGGRRPVPHRDRLLQHRAYHHGKWFQTATGRPFIFRFEDDGGILPVHGVGVTVQGQLPSGGAGLRYVAEISNGRHSRSRDEEPVQNVEDENAHKAINVALLSRPTGIPGLEAGVSVYRDRLEPAAQPTIDETIVAAHVVYQVPLFEQLNEAIFIRHTPADTGPATTTSSFYTQISRQFGRARPYFRYEFLDVPDTELVFRNQIGRSYGPTVGLRLDAAPPVAVKLEYTRLTGSIDTQTSGFTVQFAFVF